MKLKGLLAWAGIAVTGIFVACSSGNASGVSGNAIPSDQLGAAYKSQVCPALQSCCSRSGFTYSAPACEAEGSKAQASVDSSIAKGRVYNAQAAGNCVAQLASLVNACGATVNPNTVTDCERIFSGTAALGASCQSSTDCAAPAAGRVTCRSDANGPGRCVQILPDAEGADCYSFSSSAPKPTGNAWAECNSSTSAFTCDATTGKCRRKAAVGAACTTSGNDCVNEAYCDFATKVCTERAKAGESCSGGQQCAADLYCDFNGTKTCIPRLADGVACDGGANCLGYCDTATKKCKGGSKATSNSTVSAESCASGNVD